jgi:hypothetical protein
MTNPKRGEFQMELGSQNWKARVTMDGLARIEQACGCGILKILQKLSDGDLTTSEICSVLLPIVRSGGNDVTIKDIQSAVWEGGLAKAMTITGETLAIALSGGQELGNGQTAEEAV